MSLLHIISPSVDLAFDDRVAELARMHGVALRRSESCGAGCVWERFPDDTRTVERILRDMLPWVRHDGAVVAVERGCRPWRAAVFDLDSTLTAYEFVDKLAEYCDAAYEVRRSTARAMNGETDFETSYRERVAMLKGTPISLVEQTANEIPIARGAADLLSYLHNEKIPAAIVTGGYSRPARAIADRLGVATLYAAELEECGGMLTGRIAGRLSGAQGKVEALYDFCGRCGCDAMQAMAVGDGANDIPMIAAAGLGIMYCAAPAQSEAQSLGSLSEFLK